MKNLFCLSLVLNCVLSSAQVSLFSSSFEGGTPTADVGSEFIQTANGGNMYVVDNPNKNSVNNSNKVLKIIIPPGSSQRAEYHNSAGNRYPTENKTHFYKWKVYYPVDIFTGVDRNWLVVAQWKTWPCEEYGTGEMDYSQEICDNGGIFNDIELDQGDELDFRFRASPDCGHLYFTYEKRNWVEYVLEIYWTNSASGYYKLFANGILVGETDNVKTLFDRFPEDNSCDIYFGVGLYSSWSSSGADSLYYYIDDINVYDKDDGITLEDVCALCSANGTSTGIHVLARENNLEVFPNPATNFISFTNEIAGGNLKIYDTYGRLRYSKAYIQENEQIVVDLAAGIYIVQVDVRNKTMTKKLIIR